MLCIKLINFNQLKKHLKIIVISLTMIELGSLPLTAQENRLRVGVAGSAPFVIRNETKNTPKITGISIDIWESIAISRGIKYQLIPQENVSTGINNIADGKLDILIGPISIRPERIARKKINFTQPYFIINIGLLLPANSPSLWSRVAPFFGRAALSSIIILSILLFIIGNLIWLAERKQNCENFPSDYKRGVGNGIWFALVTLTTVGYGDRVPITKTGKVIASIWMMITLVTVSSITAGLASAFTVALSETKAQEKFLQPSDIKGAKMAVVSGTTGVEWGAYYEANLRETATFEEAVDLVIKGQAEGMIFDIPALKYYLSNNPEKKLRVSHVHLGSEAYGFVLPPNSPLEEKLDILMLKMLYNKRAYRITSKWVD